MSATVFRRSHCMVGVLVGNGDGFFQPATAYSSDGWSFAAISILAVADVNGDSKPDFVVATWSGELEQLPCCISRRARRVPAMELFAR